MNANNLGFLQNKKKPIARRFDLIYFDYLLILIDKIL